MKFKQVASLLLSSALLFTAGASLAFPAKAKAEEAEKPKVELMFMLDEGQKKTGPLSCFETKEELYPILDQFTKGIRLFEPEYKVAVHFYPTYLYCAEGFGKDPSQPLNRMNDTFYLAMDYFKEQGIGVYLEAYSSGIRTQEHEGLPEGHTPAPLHYGEEKRWKSLPLDMECLAAIKEAYPETLEGIRFHELIGSNEQGLKARENGTEETAHGFVVEDEVIRAYIDAAAQTGLKLVWSDHSWNTITRKGNPVKFSWRRQYFQDWLDYAVDKLGPENVTINWANNGWPMHQYITDQCWVKNYRGTNYGESNQSWFWQETECSTLTWKPNGQNKQNKWYIYPEEDMPIELTAAFCFRALNQGASLIQFEPSDFFFNFHSNRFYPVVDATCQYEEAPDFSPRQSLYRLADYLKNPAAPRLISADLTDYYTDNEGEFQRNLTRENPKRYTQTTLGLLYPDHQRFFDAYNAFPGQWEENSDHRFLPGVFEDAQQVIRANMTFSAIDEMLVLRPQDQGLLMDVYNARGGKILRDERTAKDEKIVAAASANLFEEYVSTLDGSADDLILIFRDGDQLRFESRRTQPYGNKPLQHFRYSFVRADENEQVLTRLLGRTAAPADGFVSLSALRSTYGVDDRCIRPADKAAVICYENGLLLGAYDGVPFEQTLSLNGQLISAAAADADCDSKDELALLIWNGEAASIRFAKWTEDHFELTEQEIQLGSEKPSCLFALRWGHNSQIR